MVSTKSGQLQGDRAQTGAPAPTSEGKQCVATDAKGRRKVLRPNGFLIYPLVDGELDEPFEFERPFVSAPAPVLDAAPECPCDWLEFFGGEVRWLRAGKRKTTAPAGLWVSVNCGNLDVA
jgi:hypothetical protein